MILSILMLLPYIVFTAALRTVAENG